MTEPMVMTNGDLARAADVFAAYARDATGDPAEAQVFPQAALDELWTAQQDGRLLAVAAALLVTLDRAAGGELRTARSREWAQLTSIACHEASG